MKEILVEDKDHNSSNEVIDKNEDGNYMDSALVKDKYNTCPSGATVYTKKRKNQAQKNQNHNIIFKDSLQNHNISLILILTGLENIYDKGTCFSKVCTLNVFHIKSINIGLHFLLQLKLQNKQVELDSIQTNLLWSNSKVTKTVVASVVKLLL